MRDTIYVGDSIYVGDTICVGDTNYVGDISVGDLSVGGSLMPVRQNVHVRVINGGTETAMMRQ